MFLITRIKKWFRVRSQTKAYKKIKTELENNPKLFIEQKAKYEKAFGVNSGVRTREQWKRLVNVYGIDLVCQIEKMTADQVNQRCNESFTQRVKRVI